MRLLFMSLAVLTVATAKQAEACSPPPPPPPERYEAWRLARLNEEIDLQRSEMHHSKSVFVATVVRRQEVQGWLPWSMSTIGYAITLQPIHSLKGQLPRDKFTLQPREVGLCGQDWAAFAGEEGELFLVFSVSQRPTRTNIIQARRLNSILVPELQTAIDALGLLSTHDAPTPAP